MLATFQQNQSLWLRSYDINAIPILRALPASSTPRQDFRQHVTEMGWRPLERMTGGRLLGTALK